MKRNRPLVLSVLPLAFGILALGLLAGCPWSPGKNIKPPDVITKYLPQTSPANVLTNLQFAYEDQSIDEYKKLFAQDFVFVFNPADVNNPTDPTPAQWALVDEIESTTNMFESEVVDRVELTSYVLGAAERADSVTYGPRAWRARVDAANLLVATRTEDGEPLIYIVDGTTEIFFFREEPSQPSPVDGRPTWYIFRWEDQPIGKSTPAVASAKPDA